jgi:hypothetical protein
VVSACIGCHGPDLGGQAFIDEPIVGQIYTPNLTSGTGGRASRFSSEDWVRMLRHGVDKTGRPLLFMPSQYLRRYGDAGLGAIVAYIQSVPPVDGETGLFKERDDTHYVELCSGVNTAKSGLMAHYRYWTNASTICLYQLVLQPYFTYGE